MSPKSPQNQPPACRHTAATGTPPEALLGSAIPIAFPRKLFGVSTGQRLQCWGHSYPHFPDGGGDAEGLTKPPKITQRRMTKPLLLRPAVLPLVLGNYCQDREFQESRTFLV